MFRDFVHVWGYSVSFFGFSEDINVQSESHPKDSLCYFFIGFHRGSQKVIQKIAFATFFGFHTGSQKVIQMKAFGKLLLVEYTGSSINSA